MELVTRKALETSLGRYRYVGTVAGEAASVSLLVRRDSDHYLLYVSDGGNLLQAWSSDYPDERKEIPQGLDTLVYNAVPYVSGVRFKRKDLWMQTMTVKASGWLYCQIYVKED